MIVTIFWENLFQ